MEKEKYIAILEAEVKALRKELETLKNKNSQAATSLRACF